VKEQTDDVEEVIKVRQWRKCLEQVGTMKLLKWKPVTSGERRIVPRNQVHKRKKKVFERLQRNTNQPLTRSLRSQLSDSGYAVLRSDLSDTPYEVQGFQQSSDPVQLPVSNQDQKNITNTVECSTSGARRHPSAGFSESIQEEFFSGTNELENPFSEATEAVLGL